ncbi:MAG: ABC transporter ATP-binding protein [Casimicrobiaceae bacterium]
MRPPVTNLPIELDEVSFAVRNVTILDRVTLSIGAGTPTVIVGPNGSGKTTLLRLAMGLVRPTSGRVTSGSRADASSERRAIVFQRPVMLRRTAEANLRYALAAANVPASERDARVRELLALVGLTSVADRPARKLSGGEQQRLALARALAKDPQILFLDEPTASLDPAATKSVEDLICGIAARGIKVVMSTHDLGEARRLAGEVVLMHRGRIVEANDAASFFNNPKTSDAARFVAGELLV